MFSGMMVFNKLCVHISLFKFIVLSFAKFLKRNQLIVL